MTTQTGSDKKEVIFLTPGIEGDYAALPAEVKEVADGRLTLLQNGERLPLNHVKALGDELSGISEIVIPYDSNTFRVYYVGIYDEALFVLDAGMKKSKKASAIPKEQKAMLSKRKKAADEYYEEHQWVLRQRAVERMANRVPKIRVISFKVTR